MTQPIPEADLIRFPPSAGDAGAKLNRGAYAWSIFEGARDPYVILVTIFIFMPYVASVVVGDPVRGQGINFTEPYVLIEGGYAVRGPAPYATAESIDAPGVKKSR